ncbi:hypothetical protein [Salsuginibacillus kocurii]|uniref:hypothetical protein n=1 Tax=Salsuginibacillus kocurii TaxID=427078 RepID=UPI00036821A9|nr:hypothetical protein [Salsuginibacillus kocurii]
MTKEQKQLHFGFDIDGTVTDPATFVPYLNHHFQTNITLEDITTYDLTKVLGISEAMFWEWMVAHEDTIYKEAAMAQGAYEAIKAWSHQHRMTYISARGNHLQPTTTKWFDHNAIPYEHIELIGQHDKLTTIDNHCLDIYFEDKYDNAINISNHCQIPVILLDTPYNRGDLPEKVIRVNNWNEAKEWVDEWVESHPVYTTEKA